MKTASNSRVLRTIPLLIAVCLVSFPAYAKYSGGTGEPNDPYQIATAEDLMLLGESPGDYDKHFILTADIDLDPNLPGRKVFDKAVIAPDVDPNDEYPFKGVFDGDGHKIFNLTIIGKGVMGLFGELGESAEIFNLGLEAVFVNGTGARIGSLVGINSGRITASYSKGTVSGGSVVGGMVGSNPHPGILANCYSSGSVSGQDGIGGLVGTNYMPTMHIVGPTNGTISNCYSTARVSGNSYVGGLVASGSEDNIRYCFWDTQTSGQTSSSGGIGKTTAEMQTASTFLEAGWDFVGETENGPNDIWKIVEGQTYPLLSWQKYGGGNGEPNNPYLIYTAEQMNTIGVAPNDWDKHFKLMADIDLADLSYDAALIAPDVNAAEDGFQGTSFTGVFDGNGHAILNLMIQGGGYLGLFGRIETGAEVTNLGLVDVNIVGSDYVGALVGFSRGHIATSYVTGAVNGDKRVGGLTGRNWGTVTQSYNAAMVTGNDDVGGLAAANYGSITASYNAGAIAANRDAGGLVGENYGSIAASYSTGTVTGQTRVGGLVGYNWEDASVSVSFWDFETSGQATSAGGTGKTTSEMQTRGTFLEAGWDFVDETANGTDDIWWILEGQDYPRLWWELIPEN